MSQEAVEAAGGDPIITFLVILTAGALAAAGGYGLSRVFRGDVSPEAYSQLKPRKSTLSRLAKWLGNDA